MTVSWDCGRQGRNENQDLVCKSISRAGMEIAPRVRLVVDKGMLIEGCAILCRQICVVIRSALLVRE